MANEGINAQEWLNKKYPTGQRKNIVELNLNKEKLEGELDLSDFVNLKILNCSNNKLSELNVGSCLELEELTCNSNEIVKLDLSQQKKLIELNCDYNKINELKISKEAKLTGLSCRDNSLSNLSLSNANKVNLKELCCSGNQLTELDVGGCLQLTKLNCGANQLITLNLGDSLPELRDLGCNDNKLEKINLLSLNPEKLVLLRIRDNNFSAQNLSCFSRFTNLKRLLVGTSNEKKIERGVYNRFFGSFEYLENMNKLEELNISNTDMSEGEEYLLQLDNLTEIYCSTKNRSKSKLKEAIKRLKALKKERKITSININEGEKIYNVNREIKVNARE